MTAAVLTKSNQLIEEHICKCRCLLKMKWIILFNYRKYRFLQLDDLIETLKNIIFVRKIYVIRIIEKKAPEEKVYGRVYYITEYRETTSRRSNVHRRLFCRLSSYTIILYCT